MADKTFTVAGGNNITLQTAASAFTISGPNTHAQQTAISAIMNSETTYTSGTVSLSGGNNITVQSGTGQRFIFSGPNTHAQQTGISGIQNSETTYTSGTVSLSGGNNITVLSGTGNRFIFSGPNTSAQQTGISGIANSETTYTSGTVSLSALGAVTIRSTTGNQFQFSVNAQTAQTGISSIAGSNTTYTAGLVEFTGSNMVTVRSSANSRLVIDATQSVQTQNMVALSATNTLYSSGTVNITGSGLVTVQSSAANQTIIINATNQNLSAGVSTGGNTLGDTTVNTGSRLVIVGSNGITASQGTAAGATTITLSGVTQTVQTQAITVDQVSIGVSTGGNTTGNTTVNTGNRFVMVGTGNVTLSQDTGAGSSTVTISGGGQLSLSMPWHPQQFAVNNVGQNSVYVEPWQMGEPLSASAFWGMVSVSVSSSSNSSHGGSVTYDVGLYTRNASTLSLATSGRASLAWTNTSSNSMNNLSGNRQLTGTFANLNATPGNYWIAIRSSTASANANWYTMSQICGTRNGSGVIGVFGAASNATAQLLPGWGILSVTSSALPASMAFSDINGTANSIGSNPLVGFYNFTA